MEKYSVQRNQKLTRFGVWIESVRHLRQWNVINFDKGWNIRID